MENSFLQGLQKKRCMSLESDFRLKNPFFEMFEAELWHLGHLMFMEALNANRALKAF